MTAPRWIPAAIVLGVLATIACWLAWSPLGANDLLGGDEGFYGTMARNALASPRYLVSPSHSPLGLPGDKPPLYPALLALSVRAFGPTEPALRWLSILAAACIALCLAWLVRRAAGPWAAAAAAAFLVCLPYFATGSRVVAAELPLTALGSAGLLCASSCVTSKWRGFATGVLLGAAFLCKLWLIALIALPVLSLYWPLRRERAPALAVLIVTAAAVASLQLIAVALFDPGSLGHWWAVYLGGSLVDRAGGSGYAAYWLKPPSYYGTVLVHAFILLLPLIVVGVVAALRCFREPVPRALFLWAAGAIVLSLFAVKSYNYAYVVVPAWAGLAALGAHELAAGSRSWRAGLAIALAVTASALGLAREAQRLPLRYHAPGYRAVAGRWHPCWRTCRRRGPASSGPRRRRSPSTSSAPAPIGEHPTCRGRTRGAARWRPTPRSGSSSWTRSRSPTGAGRTRRRSRGWNPRPPRSRRRSPRARAARWR
jgi:4-amino-4-deoxy-L-arabinose transferase-like glycosyltransferase